MRIVSVGIFALLLILSGSTFAQETKATTTSDEKTKTLYYFHYTKRCATCNAIESISKQTITDLFPKGDATFISINLDDDNTEKLAKELEISGQTLIAVNDSKRINITNQAFMYARSKPDKLKAEIKKAFN